MSEEIFQKYLFSPSCGAKHWWFMNWISWFQLSFLCFLDSEHLFKHFWASFPAFRIQNWPDLHNFWSGLKIPQIIFFFPPPPFLKMFLQIVRGGVWSLRETRSAPPLLFYTHASTHEFPQFFFQLPFPRKEKCVGAQKKREKKNSFLWEK